jgi:uncharacterized Zn-binding protein involved in type VI secretion
MFEAARLGDETQHGGKITSGDPSTIIGHQPAARVGDLHTCPLAEGSKPHTGGPVGPAGSLTVFIGGSAAARVGDAAACAGPPDAIATGEPTVEIG